MNRRCLMIVSAILLVFSSAIAIAQEPLKITPMTSRENGNPCSKFKLRVIAPDDRVDYKLITRKPDGAVEYKGKVINPCQPEGLGTAQISPSPLNPSSQAPSITPNPAPTSPVMTPGLKHSLDVRERLKLHLETLKQSQSPSGKK